jgi:AAA+ ATPase superfamily predicted ATPase
MTFIGRKAELAVLNERYQSNRFEFCVMYGRRRVGKTTLLNKFTQDKRSVFFSAMKTSAQDNLTALSAAIMRTLSRDGSAFPSAVFASFEDALSAVFDAAETERLIFVIDEYPYLAQSWPGLASLLQHLIDRRKESSRLLLILNGSSMTQMHEEFFTSNRPLYGRKTFQIKLSPFTFFDLPAYFSKTNPSLLPSLYGVYGGIPHYFGNYQQERSFSENLARDFLEVGAVLLDEPETVLQQEVRESANYHAIFTAIANGAHKYSEISSKARTESGNVTRYLANLIFLDLIKRELPVLTGERKRTLYQVSDNMFRFWYRFIPRNLSLINAGHPRLATDSIQQGLDQYLGGIFEQICTEFLWRMNGSEYLPFNFIAAGRWWGSNPLTKTQAEFDILAHDGSGSALFCECKWSSAKVGEETLAHLLETATLPAFAKLHTKHYALFAKQGFTSACLRKAQKHGKVMLLTLADLLALAQK